MSDRLKATLALDEPVSSVPLVSPARARVLGSLGVHTVRDLLEHYPRRYLDLSCVRTVRDAHAGETCSIKARVFEVKLKTPRRNLSLAEITLNDGTETLIVTAFRQPWLAKQLKPDMDVVVAGKVEFSYGFKRMTNPFIEVLEQETGTQDIGSVVPIHPATAKIKAGMMRRLVANALEAVAGCVDPLPLQLRIAYRLMSRYHAFECIHFPHTMEEQAQARRRLAYEELLYLQLALMQESAQRSEGKCPVAHVVSGDCLAALSQVIPFELTNDQITARNEILDRMADQRAANHLLLGDVGTGKTIVAAHALAAAVDTGCQALFMAPTELLAQQHTASLGPLLQQAGIRFAVLTGSTPASERSTLLEALSTGTVDVVFGTHALLEDEVQPAQCSLVIIDEQQRFGVEQRAKLLAKGSCPDALYLTATPIPRSLALALYGNLTLSYLHCRSMAGLPRKTYVHARSDQGIAYDAAKEAVARGERVYIVCPLVGEKRAAPHDKDTESQESSTDSEDDAIVIESDADLERADVAAVEAHAAYLQQSIFVDFVVGVLHGKMSAANKQQVMEDFRSGAIDVLVATTVIEVGVDVPQATVMIVEDADRFGLAQLHQLRGRVGRGNLQGFVHLISGTKRDQALDRLAALEKTEDGFELAEYDLSLRHEGDILGNRQHGASGLKLVNVIRDSAIVKAAHDDACAILAQDPSLSSPAYRALAREIRISFAAASDVSGG